MSLSPYFSIDSNIFRDLGVISSKVMAEPGKSNGSLTSSAEVRVCDVASRVRAQKMRFAIADGEEIQEC